MEKDIVERLRNVAHLLPNDTFIEEAADEIERLRRVLDFIREGRYENDPIRRYVNAALGDYQ